MSIIRHAVRPDDDLIARCFEAGYPPSYSTGRHSHDWAQVVVATAGSLRVSAEGRLWSLLPGQVVWIPAGVEHEVRTLGSVSIRTIYTHPGELGAHDRCVALAVSPLVRELVLYCVACGSLRRDDEHHSRCIDLLADLLGRGRRVDNHVPLPSDPRARRLADEILRDPGRRVDLGDLSRRAGASLRTFERLFPSETGLSLGRWRRRVRMLHGAELIHSGLDVTTTSLRAGYDSTSAFIHRFREHFGVTPGQYVRPAGGIESAADRT